MTVNSNITIVTGLTEGANVHKNGSTTKQLVALKTI